MADKKVRRKPTPKKQLAVVSNGEVTYYPNEPVAEPIKEEVVYKPLESPGEVEVINNDPERDGFLILEGLPANYPTKLSDVHLQTLRGFATVAMIIAVLVICISILVKLFW